MKINSQQVFFSYLFRNNLPYINFKILSFHLIIIKPNSCVPGEGFTHINFILMFKTYVCQSFYVMQPYYVSGKPLFVIDNTDTVYGEYHQSVSVAVNIFSNPKYTTLEIFDKNGGDITSGPHLKVVEDYTSVIDTFHSTRVHVKGYRITVRFENLTDEFLTEYTFNVINPFGHSQHILSVLRASK